MSRHIDADALLADFKVRAIEARNWKENAILNGNEEVTIRADATIAFLTEVKLTIENAPTVEERSYDEGWMNGYNHAIDQIFKELNYLVKSHVLEELRKTVSLKR